MASFVAPGTSVFAPNPLPERGAACSIDSNGTWLAYGSGYTVVLRNVHAPEEAKVYVEHVKKVTAVKFSPDGRLLASGDEGGMLKVFEVESLKTRKEMPVLGGPVLDIAFDGPAKRIAVCGDAKGTPARVFMWESGTAQGELAGNAKAVLSISMRPENPCRLAYGTEDFLVKVHAGPPFKFTHSFEGHSNFVQCVRYSPCGSMLATASSDKSIHILDAESGKLKNKFSTEHKGSVYMVSWSDDCKFLLSCSGDKTVKYWDVESGECVSSVTLGRDIADMQVGCVMAGDQAISLSLSGDLNFLDMGSGKLTNVIQAHSSVPVHVACDPFNNSGEIYVGTFGGDVFGYVPEGAGVRFEGGKGGINSGVVAHGGKLFSVGLDNALRSAEVGTGRFAFKSGKTSLGAHPISISSASKDAGLVVVCSESEVMLFRDGRQVDSKTVKGYKATCCAIAEDGSEACVGGSDNAAHVFMIKNDKLKDVDVKLGGLQGPVSAIAYSPDGPIAIGDSVKEVTLWDRLTREVKIKNKWVFHASKITSLAFSPDGAHLASGGADTQVIIWNPKKALSKTKIPAAHKLGVNCVAWLDDMTVISGGGDGCLRKWTPKLP
mmetsp:Transcript_13580/g.24190  ORF Transcript_13580/g.24190 Transcript_13580/m.24190 type:complete len:604 (+) Transcript_13580:257-2068(+)|eukprot:CAMPEP_0184522242 /NCGR_PEP_ID=MMETSP0198_2-20121128/8176_1 /TAXON_ID=1112570 /ORGANISM="Thraustochytrium sp., Strain LLF1b" /LENGTH=603 /DNA_ID=CAMNT_0026913053 /DNA_START=233 /DNA_END=2044 /DNA_ORIENTATION=-